MGRGDGDLLHPVTAVQEERSSHDRVQEQPSRAQVRVLLPLRHRRGTRGAQPALELVNDRLNYLTPTIKPIGYGSGRDGQRRRLYDEPKTPLDRLLAAGVLSPAQESELLAYRDSLNPAAIARQIADLQSRPAQTRQGQDRTALPRRHPHRPTRGQIRHPHPTTRPPADPRFRGHSLRDAWTRFRGHLDLRHHVRRLRCLEVSHDAPAVHDLR